MTEVRRWLTERIAEHCRLAPDEVDPDRPFAAFGLTSRDAVALAGELEDLVDRALPPTVLWQHPTIRALAAFLTGPPESDPATPAPAALPPAPEDEEVAVVGLGCRLPGGIGSPEEFWELLCRGGDGVGEVPAGRWDAYRAASPAHAAAVERTSTRGGFLDEVTGFDAEFFGVSPAEAAEMDPQQRLLLEVAWEALEHAGIPPDQLAGSRTGVFVGACGDDHGRRLLSDLPSITGRTGTSAALSVLANRLSYLLDLRGPSLTVDTACSASLVALHVARLSLLAGECDTALVGGVNLLLSPALTLNFAAAGALSRRGRCAPFDASADGYIRSEGALVVVLRRLRDAERDGDPVLAVLRASGTNQDGRSNGLMAPNPAAQRDLVREVWQRAGLVPGAVGYVEAHGTGTPLGDPIEAGALGEVLRHGGATDDPVLIGSVKSNLGHLEAAAGLAGLVKCVLALRHGLIPPTLHYQRPNPRIPFAELGLAVVDQLTAWPAERSPRTCAVSAFGFGGSNAHAVLREYREAAPVGPR